MKNRPHLNKVAEMFSILIAVLKSKVVNGDES